MERGDDVSTCYIGDRRDPDMPSTPLPTVTRLRGLWPRMWEMGHLWKAQFRGVLEKAKPDIVITHQTVAFHTIEVCAEADIPAVTFLNSVDSFCLGSFWAGHPWRCGYRCIGCKDAGPRLLQYPFFLRLVKKSRRALPRSAAVVVNSEFMKKTLRELWGVDSEVVYPPIRLSPARRPLGDSNKILFFSPLDYKGVDVAIEVARRMTDQQFLFVGNGKPSTIRRLAGVSNIEHVPWMANPDSAFERSRLLIVPSVIPEGYGRVCVEAMSRGIPCVVSGVGALPATVGAGGDVVVNHREVGAWISILQRYRDRGYLEEKSRLALEEAKRYSMKDNLNRVFGVIDRVASAHRQS